MKCESFKWLIVATTLFLANGVAIAQKIKYKDLFYLLNAKKYDEAEPFLRSFLSNPKQANHPNANLQLAMLFEEKSKQHDLLTDSGAKLDMLDSAIMYYDKARGLITEKELKKNDDYYQDYCRRDLRTGKMGIKISDVQLDIEAQTKDLRNLRDLVQVTQEDFTRAVTKYEQARKHYVQIVDGLETQKLFLLRSDERTVKSLDTIAMYYEGFTREFKKYKEALGQMDFPGYDQMLNIQEISNIGQQGLTSPDFYQNAVTVWQYEKWASKSGKLIEKVVVPYQSKVLAYDDKLDELLASVDGSTSVVTELDALPPFEFETDLLELGDVPFPVALFAVKRAELKYKSAKLHAEEGSGADDLDQQLHAAEAIDGNIKALDSMLTNSISKYNIVEESRNYQKLIGEKMGGIDGLKSFIEDKNSLVAREKESSQADLERLRTRTNWLLYQNDSIPLFAPDSTATIGKFHYLGKGTIGDTLRYTYGVNFTELEKPTMYLAKIPSNYTVAELTQFDLGKAPVSIDSIQFANVLNTAGNDGSVYTLCYNSVYNGRPTQAHLFKIQPNLTVQWNKIINLDYPPEALHLSADFGVLAVNYNMQFVDKSNGLQLVSRLLFDMNTGTALKEKE